MKKSDAALGNSLSLIAKTSFIVFIGIFLSKLFTYLYRIIIARYYGPEIYGVFSLALMICGWIVAFSSLGLSEGILRFVPLYRGKKENAKIRFIFKFVNLILIISSIISAILLYFLSDFIAINIFKNAELSIMLKIFSFAIPPSVLVLPLLNLLRAYEEINAYSFISNIFQALSKFLILILLIVLGIGKNALALSYTAGMLTMFLLAYLFCKYKIPTLFREMPIKAQEKIAIRKELFIYSLPLLFSGIISSLCYWIDSFSIGFYRTVIEVGIYNAATPVASLFFIAQDIFLQLFFPLITREYALKNYKLIKELTKQVGKWILLVNLPLFIIVLVFPGAVINILFGSQYLEAINALRILAVGAIFFSIANISASIVSMSGQSRFILINTVFTACLNFVLNMILVPRYGINGAALGTSISLLVSGSAFMIKSYITLSIIPIRRKMLGVVLVSLIPTGVLLFLHKIIVPTLFNLMMIGGCFVLLYLILIYFTGCFDEHDLKILKSILVKIYPIYKRR